MTGGQPLDGNLTVAQLIQQLRGEGVKRLALVSDSPERHIGSIEAFEGFSLSHRDGLIGVEKELRETLGTTVLIYDQTCAAEKRRRRKKGLLEDPAKRVLINQEVCEGCGDCSIQSNCLSVLPVKTELGRKRRIDQSACNKDYSCLKGFCPSFVTVLGGRLKQREAAADDFPALPEPLLASIEEQPWNIVVAGVGGAGVLTIAALVAIAGHIEGKGCATMNQTGLAQKFGAVVSHVRIGKRQSDINSVRIPAGDADLLLGCDLVVTAGDEALAKANMERTWAIVNDFESVTADFITNPDLVFPAAAMKSTISEEVGRGKADFLNATTLATGLLGDSITGNPFLLGYASQNGMLPVGPEALDQAIESLGVIFPAACCELKRSCR